MNTIVINNVEDINDLKGQSLVDFYNSIPGVNTIKKFSTRLTGLKKTKQAWLACQDEKEGKKKVPTTTKPKSKSKSKPKDKATKASDKKPATKKSTAKFKMQFHLNDGISTSEASAIRKRIKAAKELKRLQGSDGVQRRTRWDLPKAKQIRKHRTETNRCKLVHLMSRKSGASFQEMAKATGWDYKTCYEGIKLVHKILGYGIIEDEKGRIYLITN